METVLQDRLTPNKLPEGERCGTCRFASTRVHGGSTDFEKTLIDCRRYPPTRLGHPVGYGQPPLRHAKNDTVWPTTDWDGWCGEWIARAALSTPEERHG